ncbi:hypothetical protein [Paraburkholderia phenoliruptrix]|uniref:hypothetical protein n=1 Tax=Paraburkholderia phenoliruptrix TaxID=252970 RepID=UPI001C6F1D8D|nr:hypothetical protein [Paraburkholderia phenoliruptrix]MBW9104651.1 hypothetical protein [Paraburkholderia phenoliruptrix]MBW9130581.1 hypothetical protein [Paraburkholderia ginsengiterrae]
MRRIAMTSCVLRYQTKAVRVNLRGLLALALTLAGLFGWRALRDLLNAIPDSNEDFGLF